MGLEAGGDLLLSRPDLKRDLFYDRASARMGLGDWQGCYDDCSRALLFTPSHAMALWSRALASAKLGQFKKARTDAMRALHFWDPEREGPPTELAEKFVKRLNSLTAVRSNESSLSALDQYCNEFTTDPHDAFQRRSRGEAMVAYSESDLELITRIQRLRTSPQAHAESAPLVIEAMRKGSPAVLRTAFLVRENEYPVPKREDSFAFVDGLIKATDELKEVFAWMRSDNPDEEHCALLLLTESGLLTARHLGKTLKCLADSSLTSTDLLTAVFTFLSTDTQVQQSWGMYEPRKSLGVHALYKMGVLPLKQWRVVDEQLSGLGAMVGVLTHAWGTWGEYDRWDAVGRVVELIYEAAQNMEIATFLFERLGAREFFDSLISVLNARSEWAHAYGAGGARGGRMP
uniref:Uncharacterized protein n=1 Tax=Chromera velia CCMP2878 TaxID=1169474 RepID=A0A0G4FN42_9ALVE|eukprot:Cvel_17892.t1-p1 / transcript=Cvel_17892.t1 / gene=Cvel_17892 / organism=Chromera_velia_CCMP2878 / gene_product=hypothetical protein / transcript_product=hypothetical protein / location=Cvel_scaffold1452:10424-11919(-) / protein_length=401 / sequence_SO=supercontig / SO=protein_coding / is_pseudo=false